MSHVAIMDGSSQKQPIAEALALAMQGQTSLGSGECPRCGAALGTSTELADTLPNPMQSRGRAPASLASLRLCDIARANVPTIDSHERFQSVPHIFAEVDSDFVVVVDEDQRALGAISSDAVIRNVATHNRESLSDLTPVEVTSSGVLFMRADSDVASAVERFASDPSVRCILLVGDDNRFMGLVTPRETLAALGRALVKQPRSADAARVRARPARS